MCVCVCVCLPVTMAPLMGLENAPCILHVLAGQATHVTVRKLASGCADCAVLTSMAVLVKPKDW